MIRCCIFDDINPAFRGAIGEGPFSYSLKQERRLTHMAIYRQPIHSRSLQPINSQCFNRVSINDMNLLLE